MPKCTLSASASGTMLIMFRSSSLAVMRPADRPPLKVKYDQKDLADDDDGAVLTVCLKDTMNLTKAGTDEC